MSTGTGTGRAGTRVDGAALPRHPLPERPPISAPGADTARPSGAGGAQPGARTAGQPAATDMAAPERDLQAAQPRLGLLGLLLVIPVAVLVAFAVGGPVRSMLVLGPIITFSLPALAMIAFWWEDWPGSRLRPGWSGTSDTLLIAAAAIVLTIMGQVIVGRLDIAGVFDPFPGPGHLTTFPSTLALAGTAFVAMLQITLVSEGWPLRRLGRFASGVAAVFVSWAVALVLYLTLVEVRTPPGSGGIDRDGPLTGPEYGAILVSIGAWQVLLFVLWRGWPLSTIRTRWIRLLTANAVVIGLGIATYAVARAFDAEPADVNAAAGCVIASGLLVGMLFDGWLRSRMPPWPGRAVAVVLVLAAAAALYTVLRAYADTLDFGRGSAADWVTHVALNGVALGVILHVAVGRRFPFAPRAPAPASATDPR